MIIKFGLHILPFYIYNFIYLFLVVLGLCCCMQFSLIAASGGYPVVAVHRLLIAVASLIAEHRLQDVRASVVVVRGLSSCGSRALEQWLSSHGAWA